MEQVKNYYVTIEETVVETFNIIARSKKEAMELARKLYREEIIILAPGECQYRQMQAIEPGKGSDDDEWYEF